MVVGDMSCVSALLVALAVGFGTCKARIEVLEEENIAVNGESSRCGSSCLETGGGSGWLESRFLSSVWSMMVCATLHLSTGAFSAEGRMSFERPKHRSGSCWCLCRIRRRRAKQKVITETKIRMSRASVPPMIGPVLASDIDHDFKLAVVRWGGRWRG